MCPGSSGWLSSRGSERFLHPATPQPSDAPFSLCLAPMRGLTGRTYRSVHERHFGGFDRAFAPFIPTVKGERVKPRLLRDVEPDPTIRTPLVPQIIGRDPDDMLLLLRAFADLGYAGANWNLGCPWPQVTRKRRGSGLLPYPDMVCAILDRVMAETPIAFSVKLRLGKDDPAEICSLLPRLDAYPLSEVIIHPRTATQMYEGTADVEAFEGCLPLTRHTVCYNGDIFCRARFERLRARFPSVRHWMLGRGPLRDPFLPLRLRGASLTDESRRVRAFHDDLCAQYQELLGGGSPILGRMKELWSYLSCSFDHPERVFKLVRKTQRIVHYEEAVEQVFQTAIWQPEVNAHESCTDHPQTTH
jgi:tRNA-dihydrouridine synthase B